MKDFSRSMRTTTVLHEPRGVSIAFQGILHRYKFIQNVQIESCSNSLVLKKGPLHPLEKRCPKPGIWGGGCRDDGTGIYRFSMPQMQKFCLLKKLFRAKYASSMNQMFPTWISPACSCCSIVFVIVSRTLIFATLTG